MTTRSKILLIASLVFGLASTASAVPIVLGNANRTATLDSATAGHTGDGNAQTSDINGHFPGMAPWDHVAATSNNDGNSNAPLSISFDVGSNWDDEEVSGTWTIHPSFWSTYGYAVISMHVGQGSVENTPDHFVWLIDVGATSGTFSYERLAGGGGGFSNIHLWGAGEPTTQVPDSGSTVALLGLALIGLSFARKLRR